MCGGLHQLGSILPVCKSNLHVRGPASILKCQACMHRPMQLASALLGLETKVMALSSEHYFKKQSGVTLHGLHLNFLSIQGG